VKAISPRGVSYCQPATVCLILYVTAQGHCTSISLLSIAFRAYIHLNSCKGLSTELGGSFFILRAIGGECVNLTGVQAISLSNHNAIAKCLTHCQYIRCVETIPTNDWAFITEFPQLLHQLPPSCQSGMITKSGFRLTRWWLAFGSQYPWFGTFVPLPDQVLILTVCWKISVSDLLNASFWA